MGDVTKCLDRLDAVVSDLESSVDEVADAGEVVELLVPLERRLAAVRGGLAARAAEQKVHQRSGHADEVQWLARTSGVSRQTAKNQLDTAYPAAPTTPTSTWTMRWLTTRKADRSPSGTPNTSAPTTTDAKPPANSTPTHPRGRATRSP
ncbi:MAG: hypothetical protein ACR2QO_18205 [Acidimicrobiales bacterium]